MRDERAAVSRLLRGVRDQTELGELVVGLNDGSGSPSTIWRGLEMGAMLRLRLEVASKSPGDCVSEARVPQEYSRDCWIAEGYRRSSTQVYHEYQLW